MVEALRSGEGNRLPSPVPPGQEDLRSAAHPSACGGRVAEIDVGIDITLHCPPESLSDGNPGRTHRLLLARQNQLLLLAGGERVEELVEASGVSPIVPLVGDREGALALDGAERGAGSICLDGNHLGPRLVDNDNRMSVGDTERGDYETAPKV